MICASVLRRGSLLSAAGRASGAAASAALSAGSLRRCSLGASPSSVAPTGAAPSAGAVASRVVTVRGLLRSLATGGRTAASATGWFARRRGAHQRHTHGGLRIVGTHLHGDLIAKVQQGIANGLARLVLELGLGQQAEAEDRALVGLKQKIFLADFAQ